MDSDRSLWIARTAGEPAHEPLAEQLEVDIAVVGGGIVGATAALLLANEGRSVALLEARRIGEATTGNSTAKMSYIHGGWAADLIKQVGRDSAHRIIHGERAALDVVRHWTAELGIEESALACTNWLYGSTKKAREKLEREAEALDSLGIESRWATVGEVPYGDFALGVDDQLNIEPCVLARAFATHAATLGARVHEGTRVMDIDPGEPSKLTVSSGATVRADHLVLATQVPILDRSMVFAASRYQRSHVVALAREDAFEVAPDMYSGADPGGLSVRPARDEDGSPLLVVAGNGHELGDREDGTHVDELEQSARELTGAGERRRAWLAHDVFPSDGHAFIGPIHGHDNVHVATGFGAWGLSGGVSAAMAIAGMVIRGHAAWQPQQSARRLGPYIKPSTALEGLRTAKSLVVDRLITDDKDEVAELAPGRGLVTRVEGRTVAVARDAGGALRVVDAACTHQGCIIQHDDERNHWQCPCHGSRFDLDGAVINGPAVKALEVIDPDVVLSSGRDS